MKTNLRIRVDRKGLLTLVVIAAVVFPARSQFVKERKFMGKALVATGEVFGMEAVCSTILYLSPREFSNWEEKYWLHWGSNLRRAYTSPPVWDKDGWGVNYVGHPIQGTWYFNSLRSQNAGFWASSAFTVFHCLFWEYFLEAINEQPSINDMITTPIGGIALGELAHLATLKLKRGGFTTFEKVLVTLINPFYVINNGYKQKERRP